MDEDNMLLEYDDMDAKSSKANGQTFLKTLVHFGVEEKFMKDEEIQRTIRKETNFQVTRRIVEFMGGKLIVKTE